MTLYEFWHPTSSSDVAEIYGSTHQRGMSFTVGKTAPNEDFTLSSITIRIQRYRSPGIATVEVYAVDATGLPTGSALSTGNFDGNAVGGTYENKSVVMPSATLRKNTKYALTIKAPSGNSSNLLVIEAFRKMVNPPAYPSGNLVYTVVGLPWLQNVRLGIWFEVYGIPYYEETEEGETVPETSPFPPDTYISGFIQRYQKRQVVGYHAASGDLRSIAVCASGELMICSGVHVVADVEVEVSSGQHVVISGQHVFVESGVHVVADIAESGMGVQVQSGVHIEEVAVVHSGAVTVDSGVHVVISGQPVTISGDHVFVESGISHLYGYHHASGIWVPIAVTLSGCLAITYCTSGGLF